MLLLLELGYLVVSQEFDISGRNARCVVFGQKFSGGVKNKFLLIEEVLLSVTSSLFHSLQPLLLLIEALQRQPLAFLATPSATRANQRLRENCNRTHKLVTVKI
ncbi:unnamed protein product [Gongylonema pulchrum]|uniref:Secreted protein n=1 Tax=Gongylonema pulchrum TaxID=637853 RepID=A0A183DSD4_9BILA|nr:unnamed protein product [Gongylonema pulchrum]